ncbi:unnamed protein product [Amaranthus hypochondriacus]
MGEEKNPNSNHNPTTLEIEEIMISSNPKIEMTIDEVIENYVGSLGYSQIIQAILVSLAWMFDAQITLVTIFSDANPKKWKCKPNYTCHNTNESVCGLKNGSWEWIDGHKSSIIAEWGLVCHHNFLAALPASCFFFGSLLGAAVYGRLADSFLGRKRTLILASLLTAITAFLTSFSINIWTYAICRFLNGLTRSGIGICCLVLATEVVGRKWRGQIGQYGFFFFTLGFISLPLIAFYTKSSWRLLYQILSLLVFLYSIFILPFVAESPRWLLIRGRKNEALLGLSNLASRNGRSLPANIELTDPSLIGNDDEKKMMSLWGCKWARVRMGKAMIAAFGVGFVYYAVQLNVENLNFNKYVSVAINALIEIPAVFGGSFLLGFMKRRLLFFLSCLFTGISCFLCIIFTKSGKDNIIGNWIQLGIEGIGFMAASLAFDLMFIYCVELFPTNVRNFAVSLMRQALVLGAAVSPLLVVVGRLSPAFSFLVIGVLSILSGLMSICLPETKNLPLFETLEQQEKQNLAHPHHASSNHSST